MLRIRTTLGAALLLGSAYAPAMATTTQFADISPNGANAIVWSDLAGTSGIFGELTTANPSGAPVYFKFESGMVDPAFASLMTPTAAIMSIANSDKTTQQASVGSGTASQPLTQTITIDFELPNPITIYGTNYQDLLKIVISPDAAAEALTATGGSVNFNASSEPFFGTTEQKVIFSSDFLKFSDATQADASFSFTGVNPALALTNGATGYFTPFTTSTSGNFSSNPAPTPVNVPEPVGMSIVAMGLIGLFGARRRIV